VSTGALSNYASSIACTLNGQPGSTGSGTSLEVTVALGDVLDCTFTNVRKPKITVKKVLRPSDDPGRFDLLVGSTVVKAAAGNGDSGSALVVPGPVTVGETGADGTDLSGYRSSISCTKNGSPDASGAGASIELTVAAGDVEVCAITNQRAA